MIVSNSRKFIFVHVPKAAGTSITRELARLTTFRDIEIGGTRYGEKIQDMYAARFDLRKHSPARLIAAKAGNATWRSFFVFAFVRCPYARAYSLYRFLNRWQDGPHHARVCALTFEQFVTSDLVAKGLIEIAQPQAYWLTDNQGRLLEGIDFIGRVDSFERDFSFVLSTILRTPTAHTSSQRANVSAEPDEWRAAMSPTAVAAINEIYHADFELFNFAKRLTEEAVAA